MQAQRQRLATVLAARPVCFNHNLETVQRLQGVVRRGATYRRSLGLLEAARDLAPSIPTKSGLMLGLGESMEEVVAAMEDLRRVDCQRLTLGQYLRPPWLTSPLPATGSPRNSIGWEPSPAIWASNTCAVAPWCEAATTRNRSIKQEHLEIHRPPEPSNSKKEIIQSVASFFYSARLYFAWNFLTASTTAGSDFSVIRKRSNSSSLLR
jgi:hypothetical protein